MLRKNNKRLACYVEYRSAIEDFLVEPPNEALVQYSETAAVIVVAQT